MPTRKPFYKARTSKDRARTPEMVEPAELRWCITMTIGAARKAWEIHQSDETSYTLWIAQETAADLKAFLRQMSTDMPEEATGVYSNWH